MQIINLVLLTQLLQGTPILVGDTEPLGVAGPDVHVDGGKVVVLLVAGGARPRHLHVQLDGVHAEDLMSHV